MKRVAVSVVVALCIFASGVLGFALHHTTPQPRDPLGTVVSVQTWLNNHDAAGSWGQCSQEPQPCVQFSDAGTTYDIQGSGRVSAITERVQLIMANPKLQTAENHAEAVAGFFLQVYVRKGGVGEMMFSDDALNRFFGAGVPVIESGLFDHEGLRLNLQGTTMTMSFFYVA